MATAGKLLENAAGLPTNSPTTPRAATAQNAAAVIFSEDTVSDLVNDGVVATSSFILVGSFFWVSFDSPCFIV